MHIASILMSNNNNAATRQWAPCSPLDDISDSNNGTVLLPTIYSTRAGGGGGGGGLRTSNLSASGGVYRDTGFFYDAMHNS